MVLPTQKSRTCQAAGWFAIWVLVLEFLFLPSSANSLIKVDHRLQLAEPRIDKVKIRTKGILTRVKHFQVIRQTVVQQLFGILGGRRVGLELLILHHDFLGGSFIIVQGIGYLFTSGQNS